MTSLLKQFNSEDSKINISTNTFVFFMIICNGRDGLRLDDLVNFYKKFGFEEILHQGGNVLMKCCGN